MTEGASITNLTNGLSVSPAGLTSRPKITPEEDREMVEMSRGTSLLLAARERVLSLSEQRVRFVVDLVDSRRSVKPLSIRFSGHYCPSWRTRPW